MFYCQCLDLLKGKQKISEAVFQDFGW